MEVIKDQESKQAVLANNVAPFSEREFDFLVYI